MTVITISSTVEVIYKNRGQQAEYALATTLGISNKAGNLPFDKGSDIEELHMSVKSSHFSLASKLVGDTLEEKINDYFDRVASDKFAYVTEENLAYIMDKSEFRNFLNEFGVLERASSKNGGHLLAKGRTESRRMREWLAAMVVA